MAKRIFVEKKADFQIKAEALRKELTHNLQLTSLSSLRLVQVYDVFHLEEDLLEQAVKHIFTEQVTDKVLSDEELGLEGAVYFAIEALPGQFDQRAASSQEALLLLGSRQGGACQYRSALYLEWRCAGRRVGCYQELFAQSCGFAIQGYGRSFGGSGVFGVRYRHSKLGLF